MRDWDDGRKMLSDFGNRFCETRACMIIYPQVVTATSVLGTWWGPCDAFSLVMAWIIKIRSIGLSVQSWTEPDDQITAFYAQ